MLVDEVKMFRRAVPLGLVRGGGGDLHNKQMDKGGQVLSRLRRWGIDGIGRNTQGTAATRVSSFFVIRRGFREVENVVIYVLGCEHK